MHVRIEPLIHSAKELAALWDEVYLALNEGGVPLKVANAKLAGATLEEFDRRFETTLDAVAALSKLDEASQLMFLPRVDSVSNNLKNASRYVTQLHSELAMQPGVIYKDPNNNLEPLQRHQSGSHTANINAAQLLETVQAALASAYDLSTSGVRLGRGQSTSLYFRYGEQLRNHMIDARSFAQDAKKKSEAAASSATLVATKAEEAQKLVASLEVALDEAQKDRAHVTTTVDEAQAKLAVVREAALAAASLQKQVTTYAAEFDSLQKSLTTMLEQHNSFIEEMNESREKNENREDDIDRLTAKAESMIKGATTAGLGDSLEKTRELYEKRMKDANKGFLFSVGLLLVCALPLLAQLFPGLFATWLPALQPSQVANPSDAFIALVGKLMLLFPATWLTSFYSKSYSEFFHLEREYAHKAALARSVEGFKKQAPKYEEEITTAVFFEIQSNPSKQAAPDAAEHPIAGPLMKRFIDALPLGKQEPKSKVKTET